MAPEVRAHADSSIALRLTARPEWNAADTVLLYHALPDEVATLPILEDALAAGKRLYLPRLEGREMHFHRISSARELRELTPQRMGIAEPPASAVRWELEELAGATGETPGATLIVCPGRAFDAAGRRLGRGGSYYDRFLTRLHAYRLPDRLFVVGICYQVQVVPSVPVTPDDQQVDLVVTEAAVLD